MKGQRARIWIASPSAKKGTDPLWDKYRELLQKHTDWADEETIFDHYDEEKLTELVETHGQINAQLKKRAGEAAPRVPSDRRPGR